MATLVTHRETFAFERTEAKEGSEPWAIWISLLVLVVGTAFTAWQSELVSGALGATASQLGWSRFFLEWSCSL
ncbi:MAG: hypothetical protein ABI540_09995 [Spartobacteria bacterium]